MPHLNIIRAWKDAGYRLGLSDAERVLLPENPAGVLELTDRELSTAVGGMPPTCDECSNMCSMMMYCGSDSCTYGPMVCFMSCGGLC
jgi:mersacidin/lichenicidin family type 2 lantibiotic